MLSDGELTRLLRDIQKPARYIGREVNAVEKDFDAVRFRIALAFPDIYEIGMSHLGLQILYGLVNSRADALAERVFMPWFDMAERLETDGVELFSLESRRPIAEFDVVGFSLQYEVSYPTVLRMLDLAGIPRRRDDRRGGDWPLVVAGGPCAFNGEPLAEFVDLFFVGDGEDALGEFVDLWQAHHAEGPAAVVQAAARTIGGVYAPELYEVTGAVCRPTLPGVPEVVRPACVSDLDAAFFPTKPIVPLVEAVHDRIGLEVMRGCSRGCRFCQAGMTRRPVRVRSVERLLAIAEESYRNTGHDEISLLSLATGDYPHLARLARMLSHRFTPLRVGLAYPSLRADKALEIIPQSAGAVRKGAITIAVEAGTERLRGVINKGITEEGLLKGMEVAFKAGWKRVKLYFMAGLPTETTEDIRAIAVLVEKCIGVGRAIGISPNVNVSIAPFIPKPGTPFQWEPMRERAYLEGARSLLREGFSGMPVKMSFHNLDRSIVEAALARGGRELAGVLERAADMGVALDAWDEAFDFDRWRRAFDEEGLGIESYACRRLPGEAVLAWGHVSSGVDIAFLKREHERALKVLATPDCRQGACNACGLEKKECDKAGL